jgi:hypothetical protein
VGERVRFIQIHRVRLLPPTTRPHTTHSSHTPDTTHQSDRRTPTTAHTDRRPMRRPQNASRTTTATRAHENARESGQSATKPTGVNRPTNKNHGESGGGVPGHHRTTRMGPESPWTRMLTWQGSSGRAARCECAAPHPFRTRGCRGTEGPTASRAASSSGKRGRAAGSSSSSQSQRAGRSQAARSPARSPSG